MKSIMDEYLAIREQERAKRNERRAHAYEMAPMLRTLEQEYAALHGERGRKLLEGDASQVEQKIAEVEHSIKAVLKAHGLPENYLLMHYRCEKCKDYGSVEGHTCSCFARMAYERRAKDSHLSCLERENFESFDIKLFPDGKQRDIMEQLRTDALQYADAFPQTENLNLLFIGSPGLGKSFLLNCIGKRVLDRGYRVVRITANQFHQQIMERVIGARDQSLLRDLEGCDLLLFDDLGCEPKVNNIIEEFFFSVLNERISANKHMCLATNLTVPELRARYGERTTSRLFDVRTTRAIALKGKDVRLLRETKK